MEDDDVDTIEQEQEVPEKPGPSIREDLEKAFAESPEPADKGMAGKPDNSAATGSVPTGKSAPATPGTPTSTPVAGVPPTEDGPPGRLKDRFAPEAWKALAPEVKQTFHDYETQIGRLGNRFGRDAQSWKEMSGVIAPYQEMITREGGTPLFVVQNLLETARLLRFGHPDQKSAMVYGMLNTFQIPHRRNEDGTVTVLPPRSDPSLIARLHNLEGGRLTDDAARTQTLVNEVEQDLESFRADQANIYLRISGFADMMAQLITSGQAQDLPSAYQQASWLHPDSRRLEIAKQAKVDADAAAVRAAAAKTAAVSVPGAPPGNMRPSTQGMSLRDELQARLNGDL